MYCLQCGGMLFEQARFCHQCGTSIELATPQGALQNENDDIPAYVPNSPRHTQKPLMVLKPRMITWVILSRYIPMQINLTIIGALLFGMIVLLYHVFTGSLEHPLRPFVFFACFFFLVVPLTVYMGYRKTRSNTYYEFYHDRLEYYDGFWSVHHKILYYKHITELTLRRNLLQRLYGVGTIHFAIPRMGPKYGGLFLSDIENPVQQFEKIENIVRAY